MKDGSMLSTWRESELQQLFILLTLPWEPSEQADSLHVFLSDQAASGDEVSAGIFWPVAASRSLSTVSPPDPGLPAVSVLTPILSN